MNNLFSCFEVSPHYNIVLSTFSYIHISRIYHDYRYDPTAVLDFLWALTCNPKLWQGRDKFTPKHYVPENILLLQKWQLLNLVAYLVSEAVIICSVQNRNAALARMDIRLDLLLHCISTEDDLISSVVNYLAERIMDNTEYEFCHIFLTYFTAHNLSFN